MNFSQLVSEDGLFSDGDWIEKKDQDINGRVRLIQLADIGDGYFKDKSSRYVTEDTASRLNCTFLEQGDILIARLPDPLGRACIFPLKGQYITAVDIAILRIKNRLYNPRYIMYLINSPQFRKSISCYESGTTRKRISRRNLDKIQFNVPDITVQERIVSKIEELFSKLDASVEELKTAKEKLKVYRQAVLKEALTPEQGWCKCCFSDLMESVRNGYGKKPDDMGEYRILRISSVRPGKVELSDFRCNQTPFKEDDLISENDLLFTRYNYFIDYDIQRYRALEYESQYCREDIECLKQDQSKLKRLKELANHQGKSGYWWTGKGSFRGVADEILKNENDPVIKKFLANLHLIYKRACLNVHACCFGNINRLGTPSGFVGVDTSPQLNGHELALYLATSSFIMVVGVTCREFKLDYEKFKENLNHLMLFYAKNMRSESNYA